MNLGFNTDTGLGQGDLIFPRDRRLGEDFVLYVVSRAPERPARIESLLRDSSVRCHIEMTDRIEVAMSAHERKPGDACLADWPLVDATPANELLDNFCPIIALMNDDDHADLQTIRWGAVDCLHWGELDQDSLCAAVSRAALRHRARGLMCAELRQFRRLFESSMDGLALIDGDGVVRMANPRAAQMLGAPGDDPQKKPRIPEFKGRASMEIEFMRADGSPGVAEARVAKIEWGDSVMTLVGLREMTDTRNADRRMDEIEKRIRALTTQLLRADHRERRRIAAGLHDDVAQLLIGIKLQHEILARRLAEDAQVAETLRLLQDLTKQALQTTRNLVFDLSPPSLYQAGFRAALEDLAGQMRARYQLTVQLDIREECQAIGEDLASLAYQAIRESLMNVVKHAQVDLARVRCLTRDGKFMMEITDHGAGFDASRLLGHTKSKDWDTKPGFGFFTLRERFQHIGGGFEIDSQPGKGTTVRLWAPLPRDG